jgi:hypothetical protein
MQEIHSEDDNNAEQNRRSSCEKGILKLGDNTIKFYFPLVVSLIAMIFSILSVTAGWKALEAASLANRWAYYSYQQSLIANRLTLIELCAMNVVSGRRLFPFFIFIIDSRSLSANAEH